MPDAPDDTLTVYVMTAAAGVRAFCPACDRQRVVWVANTAGGDTLTCCAVCQRIIRRTRTADIPPLSVNRGPARAEDLD